MIWVKINGIWMQSTPFIKNQWRQATGYILSNNFGIPEIYQGPGTESLRSSLFSLQVLNQTTYQDSYVYSSTARFGENGVSGARAAFYYEQSTGRYKNRLWYRNDKPVISYTTFGASSLSKVKISKIGSTITTVDIKPRSKDFSPAIVNGVLEMQMLPKEKAWVTINGDVSNTLFVFCDPYKPQIPVDNRLYFSPGVHHVSALAGAVTIVATSGSRQETFRGASFSAFDLHQYSPGTPYTIYLDGGAYVIGQFDLRKKHNIKVIGPGILAGDNVVEQCTRFEDDPFNTAMEPYGILSQLRGVTYSYQEQGLNTYEEAPSGLVVSGPTIVNCHFLTMPGINVIDNVKVLSPFMTNVDIKAPMPDNSTSAAIMRDSLFFMGDDAIIPTPYNAYPTNPNTGYLNVGGKFDISGCQVYTTNGGPLVLSYFGVLYPSTTPNAFPLNVYDMDFGVYTYNEGGGGKNGVPINSEHGEAAIRVTLDMSSIFSGAWANGVPKYGINNVTVSNIRFDDPIDQALLWVGNVPDPYFPTPLPFRGDEHGSMSGITFKNIAATSHTGFASSLYSNLLFSKNNTNRPKNILFQNIKLDGVALTNYNYDSYFVFSGIDGSSPSLTNDSINFIPNLYDVTIFPNPDPISNSLSSTKFSVSIFDGTEYQNAHVYSSTEKAWVSTDAISPLWVSGSRPILNYLTFTTNNSTTATISKIGQSITSIDVGPYRLNKNVQISQDGIAYVPIDKKDKLWITVNGEVSSPLFLFADEKMFSFSQAKELYPNYTHIRYTPGVSAASAGTAVNDSALGYPHRTKINSSSLVYFDPGSYVRGHFNISGSDEVKFLGQGVLTQSGIYDWWATWYNAEYYTKSNIVTFFNGVPSGSEGYKQAWYLGNTVSGLSVINIPFYFNGPNGSFNFINNLKLISPFVYSTDGPRFNNRRQDGIVPNSNGGTLINSFLFTADDQCFPNYFQAIGNSVASSCYISTHHGGIFTSYFPGFTDVSYSATYKDIDVRCYAPYERVGAGAVFRLLSDTTATSIDSSYRGTVNVTFSGIRVENKLEVPLFTIGNIQYPYGDNSYGKLLGMTSGINFIDISASSLPEVTLLSSNIVSGFNSTNKVTDVNFTNVRINGTYVTDTNYDDYFNIVGATNKVDDNINFNTT